MTVQDTAAIFKVIQGAYPAWKPNRDTMAAWAALFIDEKPEVVLAAIKAFISSDDKGFAPNIGQIKRIIHTPPDMLTESEAWALVHKAIQNGIYGCYVEFDNLPYSCQLAVGSADQIHAWAQLPEGVSTVVASNFMRNYRTVIERQITDASIPSDVKKILGVCGHEVASIADGYPPALSDQATCLSGHFSGSSLIPPQEREV